MTELRPFDGRLKELQSFYAITDKDLAERAGISLSMVKKLKSGERKEPGRSLIFKLARVFRCPVSDLF